MTEDTSSGLKIGELLIAVGRLTTGDLTEAIQISRRMGVPIGRVLVMSGCVNEALLQQALKLQSLVKDKQVDQDTGIAALKMVFNDGMELEDALKTFNWQPNKDVAGNKLGDLLVDSNIVTRGQLDRALEAAFQSGMPLGGTLVLQGVLSPMLLPTVLQTQEQIRDGKMTREEAIHQLKMNLIYWAKAGESKQDTLEGSIFGSGGASSTAPGSNSNTMPTTSGPIPVAQQPLPQYVHPSASGSVDGANDERTRPQQYSIPPQGAAPQMVAPTAAAPMANPAPPEGGAANMVSLVELLKLSGVCTQQSLEKAIQDALEDPRIASKVLLACNVVDSETLNMYVRCQALIARGVLRTDQVLYALNSVRHRKVTFEQAVAELGVTVPV